MVPCLCIVCVSHVYYFVCFPLSYCKDNAEHFIYVYLHMTLLQRLVGKAELSRINGVWKLALLDKTTRSNFNMVSVIQSFHTLYIVLMQWLVKKPLTLYCYFVIANFFTVIFFSYVLSNQLLSCFNFFFFFLPAEMRFWWLTPKVKQYVALWKKKTVLCHSEYLPL